MNRVLSLDLLRGLAAWTVAVAHFFTYHAIQAETFETISIMGVEVFFVLSGYVLAPQIMFCAAEAKPKVLWIFLIRRWMRTVPPYVVALVVISVLLGELGSSDFFRYIGYVQNLFQQSNQADYFSIAWSLSVEEWFYVVFPGMLLASAAFTGRGSAKLILTVSAIFLAVIALARSFVGDFDDWGAAVRRVVIYRVDAIAYGFLLYLVVRRARQKYFEKLSFSAASAFFIASTALMFWGATAIANDESLVAKHLFPWLAALFGSSCILLALRMERPVASRRWLSEAGLFGGRISYSVYLFHLIFLLGLGSIQAAQSMTFKLVAYVGAVVSFATLFYWTFERPILLARPSLGDH